MSRKRELKFRAWHTEQKRMIDVYGLGKDFLTENTLDGINPGHNAFCDDDMNFIEVMQYTSLKDKNGVEIWENDIIQWDFMNGRQIANEQVMHSLNWDGQISPQNAPFMSAWGSTCGKYYRTFMNIYDPTRFATVIGNIHTTPNLLTS